MPQGKTYYLIDFENVHEDGLSGSDTLGSQDYVHLFSTKNAPRISIQKLTSFNSVHLFSHEIPAGRQSLDMHLVSYLGYLIGGSGGKDTNYVIVSKDTDYDNIISFWKSKGVTGITRQDKIYEPPKKPKERPAAVRGAVKTVKGVSESSRRKSQLNTCVQRTVSEAGYPQQTISKVASIVVKHSGKEAFADNVYNDLQEEYNDCTALYETILPVIREYEAGWQGKRVTGEATQKGTGKTSGTAPVKRTVKATGRTGAKALEKAAGKSGQSASAGRRSRPEGDKENSGAAGGGAGKTLIGKVLRKWIKD